MDQMMKKMMQDMVKDPPDINHALETSAHIQRCINIYFYGKEKRFKASPKKEEDEKTT